MIGFLANSIGKWQLKRRYSKLNRAPEVLNLSNIKSARVVFFIEDERSYDEFLKISNQLRRESIEKVSLVGYYSTKEIPNFVDEQLVFCVGLKDLGITGMPINEKLNSVLNENLDLLLDFTTKSFFPTDLILALTNAKVKVGKATNEKQYIFDLIIDIREKAPADELFTNMMTYLKMLNH